jgi:uncharacterized protein (DUF433 family)
MTTEVERFREEAERMRRVPGIIFTDSPCGRVARVAGTGLEVFEVIMGYRSVNWDYDRLIIAFHWLTEAQLHAAVTYYELYRDEIDAEIAENDMYTPEYVYEEYPSLRPKPQ